MLCVGTRHNDDVVVVVAVVAFVQVAIGCCAVARGEHFKCAVLVNEEVRTRCRFVANAESLVHRESFHRKQRVLAVKFDDVASGLRFSYIVSATRALAAHRPQKHLGVRASAWPYAFAQGLSDLRRAVPDIAHTDMDESIERTNLVDSAGTKFLLCVVPAVHSLVLQWAHVQRQLASWFEREIAPKLCCCAPTEPALVQEDEFVAACNELLLRA